MYPIFGTMSSQVAAIGVPAATVTKPIILGEFGEYLSRLPSASAAAVTLAAWEKDSCDIDGFRFSGWITWTWDNEPWEQYPALYNMTDDHYVMAKALDPASLDPSMAACQ
jgi:hypothetical protein